MKLIPGQLGGLLTSWNPKVLKESPFFTSVGIYLEAQSMGWVFPFNLVNSYGPYLNHEEFWNRISSYGRLLLENLIIGGDNNFSFSTNEVWEKLARPYPLAYLLYILFSK